jgi:hypothetical protein
MGFSKFEFRPIGSFRYIEGFLGLRVQKKQAGGTFPYIVAVIRMQISVLRKNVCSFGNISV